MRWHYFCGMRAGLIALFVLIAGCDGETPGETWLPLKEPLMWGEAAEGAEYEAVVALSVVVGESRIPYCSGVMIAPDVVLTAAHCLGNEAGFDFETLFAEGGVAVLAGESVGSEMAETATVTRFEVPPEYDSAGHRLADIALARLDAPLSVRPWRFAQSTQEALDVPGHAVEFFGFGRDESGADGRRLKVEGTFREHCTVERMEYQCSVQVSGGGDEIWVPADTFVHDIEKGGPCFGDSGGPVTALTDGERTVIGVTSFGDDGCGRFSVSTDVGAYSGWVHRTMDGGTDDGGGGCSAAPARSGENAGWMLCILAVWCVLRLKRRTAWAGHSGGRTRNGL